MPKFDYDYWKLDYKNRPSGELVNKCPDCYANLGHKADYCQYCGWMNDEEDEGYSEQRHQIRKERGNFD